MTFLNPSELAERWHLSVKTLERWRSEGSGPVYLKLHGKVLYRLSDVEDHETRYARRGTGVPVPGPAP